MKKIINTLAAFVAIFLAVAACQTVEIENPAEENKPEEVTPVQVMNTYTFAIVNDNDATKTVIGDDGVNKFAEWEDGDHLAYLINDSGSTYSEVEVGGSSVTFNVTGALTAGDYLFAWYPNYEATEASSTEAKFNVPYAQTQDVSTGYDLDAFPMVAKPIEVTSAMLEGYDPDADNSKPLADVRFANLGSLINFKVFSSIDTYQAEKVISVTFDAGTDNIAGTYAVDLMGIDFDDEESLVLRSSQSDAPLEKGSSVITTTLSAAESLSTHTSKGTALDVYMTVIPGSYSGRVVVLTDQASYTFRITSTKSFARGAINTLGLDLKKVGTTAVRQTPVSFDLTTNSYVSASDDAVTWRNNVVDMVATKESGTKVNNYLGGSGTYTHTRLYTGNKITFIQNNSSRILKVVFTTTDASYNYLSSDTSEWTNADATKSTTLTSVLPNDKSASFYASLNGTNPNRITRVDIYYYGVLDPTLSAPSISRTSPLAGDEEITFTPLNLTDVTYSVQGVTPAYVDGENIIFDDALNTMTVPFWDNVSLAEKTGGSITVRATGKNIWGEDAYAETDVAVSQVASVFSASSTDAINIVWDDTSTKTVTFTSSFTLTTSNITNSNTTNFTASFVDGVNPNEYTLSIAANASNSSSSNYTGNISVTRNGLTPIVIAVSQAYKGGSSPLDKPTNVSITSLTTTSFAAEWDNDANADDYTWYLSLEEDPEDAESSYVATGSTSTAAYDDVNDKYTVTQSSLTISGATTYYFHIKAEGSGSYEDSDFQTDRKAYILIDGSQFASAATAEVNKTYGGQVFVFKPNGSGNNIANQSVTNTASNYFNKANGSVKIGKSGAYIHSNAAMPGDITQFYIYSNKNASTAVQIGVNFSASSIVSYNSSASNTYKATLSSDDHVYDCSASLASNTKYFWFQITSTHNAQVQILIDYIPPVN